MREGTEQKSFFFFFFVSYTNTSREDLVEDWISLVSKRCSEILFSVAFLLEEERKEAIIEDLSSFAISFRPYSGYVNPRYTTVSLDAHTRFCLTPCGRQMDSKSLTKTRPD